MLLKLNIQFKTFWIIWKMHLHNAENIAFFFSQDSDGIQKCVTLTPVTTCFLSVFVSGVFEPLLPKLNHHK